MIPLMHDSPLACVTRHAHRSLALHSARAHCARPWGARGAAGPSRVWAPVAAAHMSPTPLADPCLPADVAADDDVAAEDGVQAHHVVDGERHDASGHRELDRGRVDDADDVARARRLEDAEEGAVEAVLGVELDDLLVVVGALEQLDARVERAAVRL